jgi:hypothetical protein
MKYELVLGSTLPSQWFLAPARLQVSNEHIEYIETTAYGVIWVIHGIKILSWKYQKVQD